MQGEIDSPEKQGIIPRMVHQVFDYIERSQDIEFIIKVSMIEVYMEKIKDLLNPENNDMKIREDKIKGIYLEDLNEISVENASEVINHMTTGMNNRSIAFTNMNATSSRSHSIFILTICQKDKISLTSKTGKLYLVDLAGSERIAKTGATGQTMEEGKMINKSLTCLGMVINALTDGKSSHIPYRDSKLTRILCDSLGGNSKTVLIITCSPSSYNEQETLSTLRFGERAKKIKNTAKINKEESVGELKKKIEEYENIISTKTKRIKKLEATLISYGKQVPESNELNENDVFILPVDVVSYPAIERSSLPRQKNSLNDSQFQNLINEDNEEKIQELLEKCDNFENELESNKIVLSKRIEELIEVKEENKRLYDLNEALINDLDKEKEANKEKEIRIKSLEQNHIFQKANIVTPIKRIKENFKSMNELGFNSMTKNSKKKNEEENWKNLIKKLEIMSSGGNKEIKELLNEFKEPITTPENESPVKEFDLCDVPVNECVNCKINKIQFEQDDQNDEENTKLNKIRRLLGQDEKKILDKISSLLHQICVQKTVASIEREILEKKVSSRDKKISILEEFNTELKENIRLIEEKYLYLKNRVLLDSEKSRSKVTRIIQGGIKKSPAKISTSSFLQNSISIN